MPEETPPDDVHLDLFYGVPAWLLALLLARPGRGPLRNLVAELHQEHRGGYMSIALIVAPRMAGKLYNVAAIEAPMTKPYVLLRVHCERRRTVFVVGARAASDHSLPTRRRPPGPQSLSAKSMTWTASLAASIGPL